MPDLVKPPPGAAVENAHGLVVDADKNIILTYQNDGKTDSNCLIKFAPDGGVQYLYHANNAQKLTKTKMDGTIVWQRNGNFGQDPKVPYRPTWFSVPPKSDYI